jgi:isoquinoline 1-oxidoreductase subunit beta
LIHGIARDRIVVYNLSSPSYEGRRWVDVFAIALDRTSVSDAAELTRNMDGAGLSPWVGIAPDGTISTMWRTIEIDQPSILPQLQILPQDFAADWDKVRIVPAPIIERIYRNPVSSDAMTMPGGTACAAYYNRLRAFGAQVRRVLMENTARKGDLQVDELHKQLSIVVNIDAFAAPPVTLTSR